MTARWLRVVLIVATLATGCAPNAPESSGGDPKRQERISKEIDTWAWEELVVEGKVVGQRVKPGSGEICLVCNLPITNHDAVYLVGQRVAIHLEECEQVLRSRAGDILAKLKPRGAFLGAGYAFWAIDKWPKLSDARSGGGGYERRKNWRFFDSHTYLVRTGGRRKEPYS